MRFIHPAFALTLVWCWTFGASAADPQVQVMAHAEPDEFYKGIGQPYEPYTGQTPGEGGIPKVNYDYLWGMATDGKNVWIGLGGGVTGVAGAQYSRFTGQVPVPIESRSAAGVPYRVFEYGESTYPFILPFLRARQGDWRPPRIFQHDASTGQTVERTPNDPLLYLTLGLRSAGVKDGVAILAGPTLFQLGICLFAFDAETGQYLGSTYLPEYSNIRKWVVASGELYTSVLNTIQSRVRGSVLRWAGSRTNPFKFEVVGHLDNEGVYLAEHDGRLVVGTWASVSYIPVFITQKIELPPPCGLWMSPPLPRGGLRARNAGQWQKVWEATSYDPDPVVVLSFSLGVVESYNGYLYWGTLEFPGAGMQGILNTYGGLPPAGTETRADRLPIILRGRNLHDPATRSVELLYAPSTEWVFHWDGQPAVDGRVNGTWALETNKMGGPGLYGGAGFGNPGNAYIWSSAVHNGKLYFGTADGSGALKIGEAIDTLNSGGTPNPEWGADLWRFDGHTSPAVPVTRSAFQHYSVHGFRTMVSTPYGLYLGTANSANLLSDRDDVLPDGGWELLKLISDP